MEGLKPETSTHYSRSPGPWVCEARNHAIADTGDVEGCLHITDAEGERVIEIWSDHERDEANARLIAAAPDMLAKLIEWRGQCSECHGTGQLPVYATVLGIGRVQSANTSPCPGCADIRAVIAKATGGAS